MVSLEDTAGVLQLIGNRTRHKIDDIVFYRVCPPVTRLSVRIHVGPKSIEVTVHLPTF